MKFVGDRLHVYYDIVLKGYCIIKAWSNKLREIGSLFDRPRNGRLIEREMLSMMIEYNLMMIEYFAYQLRITVLEI